MTTKCSPWDLTQDGHQKLSMGYLNQDGHQPKALHGSSSEKAISNSAYGTSLKMVSQSSSWNLTRVVETRERFQKNVNKRRNPFEYGHLKK